MSGDTDMSAERLAALAEAYGGDPARWPADAREAARRLAAADADAGRMLAEAARLDALLDAAPDPPLASAALAGRVLAAAPKPKGARLRLVLGALWRPVTGLAVATALGVMVGALMPAPVGIGASAADTGTDTEITALITSVSLNLDAPR